MAMSSGDLDQRTRVSVFMMADGRQKYFNFYCIYCGQKVCELSGGVVYQLRDTDDISLHPKPVTNVRCWGKYCRAWFEFHLNP